jgi:hypothetical protein
MPPTIEDPEGDELELRTALHRISERCGKLPNADTRTAEEIIGFDDNGALDRRECTPLQTTGMSLIPVDHPLIGTWVTDDEDSDAAFVVAAVGNQLQVTGFCRSSGEAFEITDAKWDGAALSFVATFPPTGTVTKNVFRVRPDGRADLELTSYEIWKKKDVKPSDPPEAWRTPKLAE